MAQETIILDFEVDLEDSIESIDKLTAANKELRKERNALNLATESGKKRAAEINAVLDQNTATIKKNSSAIEQQRANIGNYRSALDGVHPALGKVGDGLEQGTQGFKAMTMQALRFIATPIGAILAALVAVFGLLRTAISQNAEVLDKFENITNAVGTVLNVIIARVGKLGEALIALASGNFTEAINKTGEAFSGLSTEIAGAVKQQQLYLELSRELEDSQRALRIEEAKTENVIKQLVVAAKNRNLTFDEQEALIRRALALEEVLVAKRAENARKDLVITASRLRSSKEFQQQEEETFDQFINRLLTGGKLTDQELDKLVEKIEALEQARGSSLAFQEKLENSLAAIQEKRAEALRKQNEELEEQARLREAERRQQQNVDTSTKDPLIGAFETRAKIIGDIDKQMNDDLVRRNREAELQMIRDKRRGAEIQEQIERQKFAVTANFLGSISQLVEEDTAAYRALASAEAIINTYLAATAALASGSKINPVFGFISAAAAIANGLAAVARINGVQFAEGGYTGPGGKYQPAGIVHRGEVVWSQKDVALAGGPAIANAMRPTYQMRGYYDGGLVTNSAATPANDRLWMTEMMKNLGPFEVSAVEMTKAQKRVKVKENISKR